MKACFGNVLGLVAVSVLIAACGSKEQPKTTARERAPKQTLSALSTVASADASRQAAAPVPPPPGTPVPPGSVPTSAPSTRGVVLNEDGVEIGLAQINEALKVFVKDMERFPNSLDEMVKVRVISRIPNPPIGRKYVLDPKAKAAVLVNE